MSSPSVSRPVPDVFDELLAVTKAARDLLAALDRMYGGDTLSANANAARERLRDLLDPPRDPRDERPVTRGNH